MNNRLISTAFFAILFVILTIAALIFIFDVLKPALLDKNTNKTDQLANYFGEQLPAVAIKNSDSIPIEGYDAFLLLGAFSGLKQKDFHGVEAMQGVYQMRERALVFVPNGETPHTAAQTVSNVGYTTLWNNLLKRLSVAPKTTAEVDLVIQSLL